MSKYVGLGTNLPLTEGFSGVELLNEALRNMQKRGLTIRALSGFYRSEPVPISAQNWYVNAVAEIETNLDPVRLLAILHEVEEAFGRIRTVRNSARTLDLDLLIYGDLVRPDSGPSPHLPHPRMTQRAFVLFPLADLAPSWCHPVTGASLFDLLNQVPSDQRIEPIDV